MSFRLFAYYCAIIGGWAAFLGWCFGRSLSPDEELRKAAVFGLGLGLTVALGLSFLDSAWNLGLSKLGPVSGRVFAAVLVGAIGGLMGGVIGQSLLSVSPYFLIVGWTLTGAFVGFSIAAFEMIQSLISKENVRGAQQKLLKCLIGGTIGGFIGGLILTVMRTLAEMIFPNKPQAWLWSPTAIGFVAVGASIGLLVGLAQIILKEAWVKVEQGFRAGRELILAKEKTVIGRGEACDIGLFGDPTIEKIHAHIVQKGNSYYLEDVNTPSGTFLNEVKVAGQAPLKSGDKIRLGKSLLLFSERPKKEVKK